MHLDMNKKYNLVNKYRVDKAKKCEHCGKKILKICVVSKLQGTEYEIGSQCLKKVLDYGRDVYDVFEVDSLVKDYFIGIELFKIATSIYYDDFNVDITYNKDGKVKSKKLLMDAFIGYNKTGWILR